MLVSSVLKYWLQIKHLKRNIMTVLFRRLLRSDMHITTPSFLQDINFWFTFIWNSNCVRFIILLSFSYPQLYTQCNNIFNINIKRESTIDKWHRSFIITKKSYSSSAVNTWKNRNCRKGKKKGNAKKHIENRKHTSHHNCCCFCSLWEYLLTQTLFHLYTHYRECSV